MNTFFAASVAVSALAFAASSASAQMNEDAARANLIPFYKALNAGNAKDAPDLIKQSTTPGWQTCRGNESCNTREEVMAAIGQRLRAIPDLKWEIKEVLISGNHVIVRGEATGTPAGVGSDTGPLISVNSAPASRAARATAYPIRPELVLVITRTGSIGSSVGPAVTTTRLPARRLG